MLFTSILLRVWISRYRLQLIVNESACILNPCELVLITLYLLFRIVACCLDCFICCSESAMSVFLRLCVLSHCTWHLLNWDFIGCFHLRAVVHWTALRKTSLLLLWRLKGLIFLVLMQESIFPFSFQNSDWFLKLESVYYFIVFFEFSVQIGVFP